MIRSTITLLRPPAPAASACLKPAAGRSRTSDQKPSGFTLVELLVVIVVLAILAALLLPAINAAIRTAKNAAVSAEINQLAQALESFKSKYGAYPPSRILLVESGNYSAYMGNGTISASGDTNSPGAGDINIGQLATRSMTALRSIWPRLQLSTSGNPPNYIHNQSWYDFNGDGVDNGSTAYILHGHECLVFFLGGVPVLDKSTQGFGMTGFGKDPTNPFSNSVMGSSMYSANRQPPYYEFNPGRLFLDPSNATWPVINGVPSGIPGYYDSVGNGPAQISSPVGGMPSNATPLNFFAYFSAYGNGNYDPNDVNFPEEDANSQGPIALYYTVGFSTSGSTSTPYKALSPSPNPYTSTLTSGTSSGTITYQKPQTYQIISPGIDGLYGVGGQYQAASTSATVPLPFDTTGNTYNGGSSSTEHDATIRQREYDNLTNFKSGTLQ